MALAICVFEALLSTMKQILFSLAIWSKVLSVMYGRKMIFCASSSLNFHSLLCRPRAQHSDRRARPDGEPSRDPSWRQRQDAQAVHGDDLDPWDGRGRLSHAPVVAHDDERPDLLPGGPPAHPGLSRTPLHPAVDSPQLFG